MGEKVKRNFARFYKLRYSRFNILDACFTTIIVLLFITLLRPAPVRPESSLGGCGSHYFLPKSPNKAGRWYEVSHRPVEIDQPKKADDNTELFTGEAGGLMGHDITRPPFVKSEIRNQKSEKWLDKLITKIHVVESSGQSDPPDGDNGDGVGILQIHECVLIDVNKFYGARFKPEDRRDIAKSKEIARLYLTHWLNKHRTEICSRIWVGGPRGWRKASTDTYWSKIKRIK